MKIENQVCSLELSKKLKKLGVKQKSLWWWCEDKQRNNKESFFKLYGVSIAQSRKFNVPEFSIYSAFTVAELGDILPHYITIAGYAEFLKYRKWIFSKDKSTIHKVEYGEDCQPFYEYKKADTEANARAKMLIWLIENKYVNPKGGE
jgi:hypothetical protein